MQVSKMLEEVEAIAMEFNKRAESLSVSHQDGARMIVLLLSRIRLDD